jgi:hypothetical protein
MRAILSFLVLMTVRQVSRIFFRLRMEWVGTVLPDPFRNLRVVALLNHTSLYEPLIAGFAPLCLIWQCARHGVLPVAEKTMRRWVGLFFRFLGRHTVVITRQRDHTWERVLNHVDADSLVVILPEGRMMRRDGRDANGRRMTVRGGIADILAALPEGRMLLVYSGGLHQVQAPGELLPRLFKTIRVRMEVVEIAEYKASLEAEDVGFKAAVVRDLTWRRENNCPTPERLAAEAQASASG